VLVDDVCLGPDVGARARAGTGRARGGGAEGPGEAQDVLGGARLFAYIENSYTFNLTGAGRGGTNELRFYDFDEGYTFNMAEFSIKKDSSAKYWWGYGLVVTAGLDAQKNHSLGIFRGDNDTFPFRNTPKYDLQEAYFSFLIPIGDGLTVKGGKFVTLLGYEYIESSNNLNFSRGYLFSLAIPLTHTGGQLSYTFSEQFSVTAGVVLGWDNSRDNNDAVSYTGQFALTPIKDLTTNLNWIVGPEQKAQEHHAGAERSLRVRGGRGLPALAGNAAEHQREVVRHRRLCGLRLHGVVPARATAGVLPRRGRGADGVRGRAQPAVDDADGPVQDLEGLGGVGGVPARCGVREGVQGPDLAAGCLAGRLPPVQDPGHHLDQPLLLVLLGAPLLRR